MESTAATCVALESWGMAGVLTVAAAAAASVCTGIGGGVTATPCKGCGRTGVGAGPLGLAS